MKKITYLIIVLTFLSSYACSLSKNDKIDEYIESTFSKCDNKEKCEIDFNNLLEYDSIYIFGIGATNEEVSNTIGFKYEGDKDISRLILFIKNKTIVYEQNLVFNDSEPYKFFFDSDKTYFSNSIKFYVEKDNSAFMLKPKE